MIQQIYKQDNKLFGIKIISHLNYNLVKLSRAPIIINLRSIYRTPCAHGPIIFWQ